jgi:RNA polymerase sigma-70 factor (ECF subfamily)
VKVFRPERPYADVSLEVAVLSLHSVRRVERPVRTPSDVAAPPTTFAAIYDAWFDDVSRWLLALGAPAADAEDLAQEVFLVVRRRLVDFDHRNVAGWLFRIASRQVAAYRRRRWFKSVLSRRRDDERELTELPHEGDSPAAALETKERRRVLEQLLQRMSDKRRATFVLFEVEGYSGEEIARIQGIPVATVWTRLHHARKEFFGLVDDYRKKEGAR